MKDSLINGFWMGALTGGITGAATYSLTYGVSAFAVGVLAFGVAPVLYEKGRMRGSNETAATLLHKSKTPAEVTKEELEKILAADDRLKNQKRTRAPNEL